LKHKPNLFLAFVKATRIASYEPVWHLVAQPVTGSGHNSHMLRLEPHFFVQLPKHGLLGGLSPVNATLRKLPRVCAYAFAPKYLILLVEQDDADIGSKPFAVKHNQTLNFYIESIMHRALAIARDSPKNSKKLQSSILRIQY
jgi:hypothetical protein